MCPTGWFIETPEAPDYLTDTLAPVHTPGVLKDVDAYDGGRRVPVERRRHAPRTPARSGSPTSRSSRSRTSAASPTTSPARRTSSPTTSSRCGHGAEATPRPRSPRAGSPTSRPGCGGCRPSAPGSTTSTTPASADDTVITNAAGVAAAPIAEFAIGRLLAVWKRFDADRRGAAGAGVEAEVRAPGRGPHARDHRSGRHRHRGRGARPRLRHDDHRHPSQLPDRAQDHPAVDELCGAGDLHAVLARCDAVVVSAPGTAGDREPVRQGSVRGDEARRAVLQRGSRVAGRRSRADRRARVGPPRWRHPRRHPRGAAARRRPAVDARRTSGSRRTARRRRSATPRSCSSCSPTTSARYTRGEELRNVVDRAAGY